MKILVTGVAGFIGSNLAEFLLKRDYEVVGVDNFNTYYDPRVKEYNIKDFAAHPKFKLYRTDLLDKTSLETVFTENADLAAVVHLAAWPGVTRSFDTPDLYIRNNIEATANLVEMCKKYGPKNFIFASTSSIYGDSPTPFIETMTTDKPLAPYPATKKACEVLLYSYSKYFDINATIFRIFNPNGLRLRPDLAIPKLIKSCLYGIEFPMYSNKEHMELTGRDYCYVEHILAAVEYVISHPFKYEIFNLGNSSPVTLKQLVDTVEKVTNKPANIVYKDKRQGEMEITYANIDKAKQALNYNPTTTIEQIVQMYLEWFVQQEEWYRKLTSV